MPGMTSVAVFAVGFLLGVLAFNVSYYVSRRR